MQPTGHGTDQRAGPYFQPYTPASDARGEPRPPSLADRIGGEPYGRHPTRWYEWLVAVAHVALLAIGIALILG